MLPPNMTKEELDEIENILREYTPELEELNYIEKIEPDNPFLDDCPFKEHLWKNYIINPPMNEVCLLIIIAKQHRVLNMFQEEVNKLKAVLIEKKIIPPIK
jgi:hypothetical protein